MKVFDVCIHSLGNEMPNCNSNRILNSEHLTNSTPQIRKPFIYGWKLLSYMNDNFIGSFWSVPSRLKWFYNFWFLLVVTDTLLFVVNWITLYDFNDIGNIVVQNKKNVATYLLVARFFSIVSKSFGFTILLESSDISTGWSITMGKYCNLGIFESTIYRIALIFIDMIHCDNVFAFWIVDDDAIQKIPTLVWRWVV